MRRYWDKYWGLTKLHFAEVMETKTSAHSIALGFAIGTFLSVLPTPFFNIFLGLIIVAIFDKVNKFALFFSLIFWNPLNLAPFYWLSLKIGNLIFGPAQVLNYELSFMDNVWFFTRRFLIGNIIVSIVSSIISYYVVRWLVVFYRKKSLSRP